MAGTAEHERSKAIEVDPAILAVIKNPERPEGAPGPVKLPASLPGRVGTLSGIRNVLAQLRRGVELWCEFREQYGDIFKASLLNHEVVYVWDADEIQKILRNESGVWSAAMGWGLFFHGLEEDGGNTGNLLTLDFDEHRKARDLLQPAFTMRATQGYLTLAHRAFAHSVPTWVERGQIDFKPEVRSLLARVANELFTGLTELEEVTMIDRALTDFWSGMMALSRKPWLSPKFRRSQRGFATLKNKLMQLAPERRKQERDDLFSRMCYGAPADSDDESLVRIFISIMFGAFDTTSAAVTSMAYLLAKHPEWQDRLREEARQVPASQLDVASLRTLKQFDWVWKETVRLMPVNGSLRRRALRSVEVCGHVLPAGTTVAAVQGAMGRHPRWWKEPLRFDPERFSPERAEDKQHPALQMAFGSGAHACIGTQLAGLEMKLLFHQLLTTARWRLAQNYDARHTYTPMGTVSGNVRVVFEPA